jgi:hypothetical protein
MFVIQKNTKINKIIKMKKINLLFFALIAFVGTGFAQTQKAAVWPELKAFHTVMAATFHPAEEGDFAPLKEKAPELYRASKVLYASEIPSNYKPEETKKTLEALMIQCHDVWAHIDQKGSDEKLKTLITDAHEIFHKVMGECKKD